MPAKELKRGKVGSEGYQVSAGVRGLPSAHFPLPSLVIKGLVGNKSAERQGETDRSDKKKTLNFANFSNCFRNCTLSYLCNFTFLRFAV